MNDWFEELAQMLDRCCPDVGEVLGDTDGAPHHVRVVHAIIPARGR